MSTAPRDYLGSMVMAEVLGGAGLQEERKTTNPGRREPSQQLWSSWKPYYEPVQSFCLNCLEPSLRCLYPTSVPQPHTHSPSALWGQFPYHCCLIQAGLEAVTWKPGMCGLSDHTLPSQPRPHRVLHLASTSPLWLSLLPSAAPY